MKELKDFVHLYVGCRVARRMDNAIVETGKLVGVTQSELEPSRIVSIVDIGEEDIVFTEWYVEETVLILRPLESMTKDDIEMGDFIPEVDSVHTDGYCLTIYPLIKGGELLNKLLKKGFDIFDLHSAGLAVHENELTEKR